MHKALRFGVHLPFRDVNEESAARMVTTEYEFKYGGSTYSSIRDPMFVGTWRSDQPEDFRADLCLLNIDVIINEEEDTKYKTKEKIESITNSICAYARDAYASFKRPQISFWITVTEMNVSMAG